MQTIKTMAKQEEATYVVSETLYDAYCEDRHNLREKTRILLTLPSEYIL